MAVTQKRKDEITARVQAKQPTPTVPTPTGLRKLSTQEKQAQAQDLRTSFDRSTGGNKFVGMQDRKSELTAPPTRFESAIENRQVKSAMQNVRDVQAAQPLDSILRTSNDPRARISSLEQARNEINQSDPIRKIDDDILRKQKRIEGLEGSFVENFLTQNQDQLDQIKRDALNKEIFSTNPNIKTVADLQAQIKRDEAVGAGGGKQFKRDRNQVASLLSQAETATGARKAELEAEARALFAGLSGEDTGRSAIEAEIAALNEQRSTQFDELVGKRTRQLARGGGSISASSEDQLADFLKLGADMGIQRDEQGNFRIISNDPGFEFEPDPFLRAQKRQEQANEIGLRRLNDQFDPGIESLRAQVERGRRSGNLPIQTQKRLAEAIRKKNQAISDFELQQRNSLEDLTLDENSRQGQLERKFNEINSQEEDPQKILAKLQAQEKLDRVQELLLTGQATTIGGAMAMVANQDKVKEDKKITFPEAEQIFSGLMQEGQITPDNSIEKAVDLFDGNLNDAEKLVKSFGLLTGTQIKTQLRDIRKARFGLTDEQLDSEEKEKTLKERTLMSIRGELTPEEQETLDQELLLGDGKTAFNHRYLLKNPDASPEEMTRAWKRQSFVSNAQPKKAKAATTDKKKEARTSFSKALDEVEQKMAGGELEADDVQIYLFENTDLSTTKIKAITDKFTTYDKDEQARVMKSSVDLTKAIENQVTEGVIDEATAKEILSRTTEEAGNAKSADEQEQVYTAIQQALMIGTGQESTPVKELTDEEAENEFDALLKQLK